MSNEKGNIILVIGANDSGQFGMNDEEDYIDDVRDLTNFTKYHNTKTITKIYCGCSYTIYSDDNHDNLWLGGDCEIKLHADSSDDEEIHTLRKINYFRKKKIKIKQIFVSFCSNMSFWLTKDNLVYANGFRLCYVPTLVPCLQNIIDIQCADKYSLALCSTDKNVAVIVLQSWSINKHIPNDIIDLIIMFYHTNIVCATNGFGNEIVPRVGSIDYQKWDEITALSHKNIVKISTGRQHSLFLDSDGNVYAAGYNVYDCLYVLAEQTGDTVHVLENVPKPIMIKWFADNGVIVKDIASGAYHNLILDVNGRVYAFGLNEDGALGLGHTDDVEIPTLIHMLSNYNIENISCGYWHSYCGTVDGKHFLFGDNDCMQCLVDHHDTVWQPTCINEKIKKKFANKSIKSVILGNDCTNIFLTDGGCE